MGVLATRQWCMRQAWHISISRWNPRPHSRSDKPPFPSLSLSLCSPILSVFALCLCSFLFPRSASLSRTHPSVPGIDYDTVVVACISSIGCRRLGISMLISCDVWLNGVVLERIAAGTPRRDVVGYVNLLSTVYPKLRVVYLRDSWIVIWRFKCYSWFSFLVSWSLDKCKIFVWS